MQRKTIQVSLDGKEIIFETGKIAKQANGSVFLHCGETSVLATACAAQTVNEEIDFFPLRVDYQEKLSSVGKTLGGFIKREGKPSTHEILVSRFIDRTLRPLFEDGYYTEVQVLAYVYSYDGVNIPDVLSICAASAALALSDIPLIKPIGAVRVGYIDGKFIVNPSNDEKKLSKLDLILAGTEDAILMIEGYCDFLTEEQILEAIEYGHKYIKKICHAIHEWQKEIGKPKNLKDIHHLSKEVQEDVSKSVSHLLEKALLIANKKERSDAFGSMQKILQEVFFPKGQEPKYLKKDVQFAFKKLSSDLMRKKILDENLRIDGRKMNEIRPIDIEVGLLGRTHGSALFTRGETQALAVCTLGGETMGQRFENLHGEGTQRFYLQYHFPPFSVGEVGRSGFPGRREIGHG
ncbi:MAG: polyribonucleotide nucleotidyltransferase, partial [Chlamydiota bacterium]